MEPIVATAVLEEVGLDEVSVLHQLGRMSIALILALAIGWDREKEERSAGLRTFPLVAVSSCAFMMLGVSVVGQDPNAIGRVVQGLMSGIGFIGGGAILKDRGGVKGMATAASIWNTAAIGAAVAFSRYDLAVAQTVINVVILNCIRPLKHLATDAENE